MNCYRCNVFKGSDSYGERLPYGWVFTKHYTKQRQVPICADCREKLHSAVVQFLESGHGGT